VKKVDPHAKSSKTPWLIALLCAACFLAGVSVPVIINQKQNAAADTEFEKLQAIYDILQNEWYYAAGNEDIAQELIEQAITGMTTLEEDPHTNYFNLEQAQQFTASLSGSNVGIGVSFYQGDDGQMVVRQVFINSTAEAAGLQPGDEIIQVGELNTAETSTDDLVSYIKGNEGNTVTLQVVRDGETLEMDVTPGTYDATVSARMEGTTGIVSLASFSENSGRDFAAALEKLKAAGATDLVIDLRDNSGGYLSAARDILSSLLPDDTVIFVEQLADGTQKSLTTTTNYDQIEFDQIAILQNENSASASEVLIGALKDNLGSDKVVTIGTTTYGKGTEQVTVPFSDGTSIKYTIAEWLTPNGTSINGVGFTPDIEVQESEVRTVRYALMDENSESFGADQVNANAKAVQIYLSYLGYPADRADEYFSSASAAALALFQQDQGLEATGVVDSETFNALVSAVGLELNKNETAEDTALITAIETIS
jgi:carboxyl-terminal processing protease